MNSDPNKKSPRTFQCRDVLWDTFDQMARELECSVDYLINESMKQYARQRNFGTGSGPIHNRDPRGNSPYGSVPPPPVAPGAGSYGGGRGAPPPRAPQLGRAGSPSSVPLPPPPARPRTGGTLQPPGRPSRSAPPPIPGGGGGGRYSSPPAAPQMNGYGASAGGTSGTLSITYQGDRVSVSKDRFVIGRGKQSSDLTLKDPNVSRQHAMVEYQNGVYFMVDMGSTNGVEFNGQRIARKQINEGDVFRICDHDLRFTFR